MHASHKLPDYPDLVVLGGGKRLFGDSGGADLPLVDSTTTGTGRGPRAPCRRGGAASRRTPRLITQKSRDEETMSTPGPAGPATTKRVQAPGGGLHVIDRPGAEPAVVLLHGFPDDSRIYHRLMPYLVPHRAVAFDFLGYGHSDRAHGRPDPGQHEAELAAVLDDLGTGPVILVGHDAGGPVAVNVTLDHPHRVARLVLLNTYYGTAPQLRLPEMIRLFADPDFAPLTDAMTDDPDQRLWLLNHTARRFGLDPLDPQGIGVTSIFPQFFGEGGTPDALAAIRAWTAALFPALSDQDARIASGQLAALDVPVSLIYGAADEYLNPGLARHLAGMFGHAELHVVDGASHWPQADQPETVARILKDAR